MNAHDRCDRCGARAYVQTIHFGNTLMWCVHHFSEHEELLADKVWTDARERLTADK